MENKFCMAKLLRSSKNTKNISLTQFFSNLYIFKGLYNIAKTNFRINKIKNCMSK